MQSCWGSKQGPRGSCGPLEGLERGEGVGLPLGCGDDGGEGGDRGHRQLGELGPRRRHREAGWGVGEE